MDYENDTAWVRKMLYPGENLLWTGKPAKGHFFRKEDIVLIPFGIMWCGFVIFWLFSAFKSNAPIFLKLWGIFFLLIGLGSTVGRLFFRSRQEKRTCYALTSQRIFAKVGNHIKTLDLCNLPHMSVNQRTDGTGDIRFGETGPIRRTATGFGDGMDQSYSRSALLELQNIPDVNQVEYRIRTAVEQALAARRSD